MDPNRPLFERWAASFAQKVPFQVLANAVVGIEASFYLDLKMNGKFFEPLLHAIGGNPYSLRARVEKDIQRFKEHDIKVIFVFDGLDFVSKRQQAGVQRPADTRALESAWSYYSAGDPMKTRNTFAQAMYSVHNFDRYFQDILFDLGVDYVVAPYSAAAQLSYLLRQSEPFVDVILGSADCFLFGADRILSWMEETEDTFDCVTKADCQSRLDRASDDLTRDCQLLLGSAHLPMFPPLLRVTHGGAKPNPRDALNVLVNANRSVFQLCHQYREDPQVQALQYRERYMKALMTVKHHVILESDGTIAPMDLDHAPGDVHEFMGQRLPDELFFYISRGLIGPEILNWMTSGEVVLTLPPGVQDNATYRSCVVNKLNDFRTLTLKLLADSLNRYYQSRVINLKLWYDTDTSDLTINIRELPSLKDKLGTWKLRESKDWPECIEKPLNEQSLAGVLELLGDETWVKRSVSKYEPDAKPCLQTTREVYINTLLRFLHARSYVNDKHELTSWGKALKATIAAISSEKNASEMGIIAIEMLRMNLFTGNDLNGGVIGTDKAMTNLISRVVCIGRLEFQSSGYNGPLDRALLSFAWMITALRTCLRDLMETVLVCMFMNGDVVRDRKDWAELSHLLPFHGDNGCGLGLALQIYLNFIAQEVEEGRNVDEVKNFAKKQAGPDPWFDQAEDYEQSIEHCFTIWDAVYAGVQSAGKDFKDAKVFGEANEWLKSKR